MAVLCGFKVAGQTVAAEKIVGSGGLFHLVIGQL